MPLLLHLADIHLGARHADMGAAAVEQRERQSAALRRAIDEGLAAEVDMALVCGDLFDSNAQSRRSVEGAVSELQRLTDRGIRVVMIPGTHDVYDSRSIYRAFDLASLAGLPMGSDLLTVLTPEQPDIVFKDLDLVVYGRVFATKRAPRSPLAAFDVRDDDRAAWKVGMIHGSRRLPGKVDDDDVIFSDAEIAASGLDYLALGHWHSFSTGQAGETTWAYAGAPEPVAVDQDGAGNVCLVRLEDSDAGGRSVRVEKVTVGRTVFRHEQVDVADVASQANLTRELLELADPDAVLQVSIEGIASDTLEIDSDELERALAGHFLHVRVRDRSVTEVSERPDLPEDTVAGKFVLDLQSRLAAAEAAGDRVAAEQARQVLRLGRRLLLDDPDHVTLP
ncbi:MAG: DNA repair exonuclease [Chloroflexota bacterium]|jgi:DNA repair exonuclease SbcCD nuclease subunit